MLYNFKNFEKFKNEYIEKARKFCEWDSFDWEALKEEIDKDYSEHSYFIANKKISELKVKTNCLFDFEVSKIDTKSRNSELFTFEVEEIYTIDEDGKLDQCIERSYTY